MGKKQQEEAQSKAAWIAAAIVVTLLSYHMGKHDGRQQAYGAAIDAIFTVEPYDPRCYQVIKENKIRE